MVAQIVNNLPAMRETLVQSLGGEDPLEKGMATHSSILAWRIPRTEEPDGLQSMGSHRLWGHKELGMTELSLSRSHTHTHTNTHNIICHRCNNPIRAFEWWQKQF